MTSGDCRTTLCDHTPPRRTRALPDQFKLDIFERPPNSPDLPPSDYHSFLPLNLFFFFFLAKSRGQYVVAGMAEGLVEELFRRRHTKAGYDMTSVLIYMTTMWRSSLM